MMKWIRVLISTILLGAIICVAAVCALVFLVDPNQMKPMIAAELKKYSGYNVVMEGNFSWAIYPNFGVKVDRIAFLTPQQTKPFIDLHQVTFVTELKELIHGQQKLSGDIYISTINFLNLAMKDAHIGVHSQNNQLILQPMTVSLYGGQLDGKATGNDLASVPHWNWDVHASSVQIRPLLADLNGKDSKLIVSGLADVALTGSTRGSNRDQLLNNLNGTGQLQVKQGAVEGMDLNYLIRTADALINKQPLNLPAPENQTSFDQLTSSLAIKEGVVGINDLMLVSSALTASGAGSINLVYQLINMQLRIASQQNLKTQWMIPVMVSGSLNRPEVRLDATELNIMVAKEKIDQVRAKVQEKIKEHFSDKPAELLQNLLGK